MISIARSIQSCALEPLYHRRRCWPAVDVLAVCLSLLRVDADEFFDTAARHSGLPMARGEAVASLRMLCDLSYPDCAAAIRAPSHSTAHTADMRWRRRTPEARRVTLYTRIESVLIADEIRNDRDLRLEDALSRLPVAPGVVKGMKVDVYA